METITLPQEISSSLGSETRDFVVKSVRTQPLKNSFSQIFFGFVWTAITSLGVYSFMPIFKGEEIHFEANGVPKVASLDNLESAILPGIVIIVFILIGFIVLIYGIYLIFKEGPYFIGTPTRLISFQKRKIKSIDWENFSGITEVSGTIQKGNILLQLRTGKLVKSKNHQSKFTPDVVYITGIPNPFEIEKLCRKRIKENDPTPPIETP